MPESIESRLDAKRRIAACDDTLYGLYQQFYQEFGSVTLSTPQTDYLWSEISRLESVVD